MKELMCKKCNGGDCGGKPILCDEDVVSVTCGTCSMIDLIDHLEKQMLNGHIGVAQGYVVDNSNMWISPIPRVSPLQ